ncbi:hypothetical protein BK011_09375 [Tenericutes bacterium MZ-XQ]|nr:hypothetical protein BK011_09375 [Tenericutes bacterium MZ-XQ]
MKKVLIFLLIGLITFSLSHQVRADEEPYEFLESGTATLLESNLFTKKESYEVYTQPSPDMTDFVNVLENESLIVYMNPVGLALRVYNKTSGFYWASDLININDYPLTGAIQRRIQSAITIDYLNKSNISISSSILKRRTPENAETSYEIVDGKVIAYVDFVEEAIALAFTIELDQSDIVIEVLRDSIEEYGDNRLTKLYLYESFGSTYSNEIPGYYFIPSGNGALIRFEDTSAINNVYRARFYGQDKYRVISNRDSALNYPVFGAVHGVDQNALFTEIEEGAEFAEYVYTPPTYQTEFHSQGVVFLMRENHTQPLSGSENITIYESEIKGYNPKVRYTVLDGEDANYVGFALTLKERLLENDILDLANGPEQVNLQLDVLMKEYEKGLLFKNNYNMTTVGQLLDINQKLLNQNVTDISYTLRGYNDGGYSDRSYDNYGVDGRLGSFSRLDDLNVSYYYDPTIMYSYSTNIPGSTLKMVNKRQYVITHARGDYYSYLVDIDVIKDEFSDAYESLMSRGGIALDGLSNELNSNDIYKRNEIYDIYQELFTDKMPMYRPQYYNLKYTQAYFMSNLYHDRSKFFTDSVPFEQILLSGTMPIYTQFLNFSSNIHIDALKMIEFGMMPSYLITAEPSYLLNQTISSDLYATYYDNLEVYIVNTYQETKEALELVIGHQIIDREVLDVGVVRIGYDHGYSVYVNYSNDIYNNGSISIPALGYLVSEVSL